MAPFGRSYTTTYQSAIVSIALSCIIFEIFDDEEQRDLEIQIRGHSAAILCTICISLKSIDPELSLCRWQYGTGFHSILCDTIRYDTVYLTCSQKLIDSPETSFYTASSRKKLQSKMMCYRRLRSFKVIEIGTNRKSIFDFLLIFHCNSTPVFYLLLFPRYNVLLVELLVFFAILPTPVSFSAVAGSCLKTQSMNVDVKKVESLSYQVVKSA